MSNQLIHKSKVVQAQLRKDIPDFSVGSIVSVHYKIIEGSKHRIQIFKGIVTDRHEKSSVNATFKVLKVAVGGIKTVRVFPLHSPNIKEIEVHLHQRGRRATLNYLMEVKDPSKTLRSKPVKDREFSYPFADNNPVTPEKEVETTEEKKATEEPVEKTA